MPVYNFYSPPPALLDQYPANRFLLFNSEAIVTGEFSQQISIPLGRVAGQKGIRLEVDFNSNPGTFEIDVMEADGDLENGALNYQQVPSGGVLNAVTTGVNGANTHASTDVIPIAGQFVCLYVKTQPSNANIKCKARISRAA